MKIDKAFSRPHLGHAIARLIGAKGLRENDVRQPSRIDHLGRAKQPVLYYVPESCAAEPAHDRVSPQGFWLLSFHLEGGVGLEGTMVFKLLADAGEEVVGRMRGCVG